jgi:Glyoxalase-like domain
MVASRSIGGQASFTQMLASAIDHLVVTASSIEAGSAWVADLLGVTPTIGGEHPAMGTHNALIRLGDALYLEVIAINPLAPAPGRARWFELDRLGPAVPPRLTTWVVRTNDIHTSVARSPVPLGNVATMTRGSLEWLITIPSDGVMPLQGAAPSLIQWSSDAHPATMLGNSGCALERLEVRHPHSHVILQFLQSTGFEGPVTVASPADQPVQLIARISTPRGRSVLARD